MIKALHNYNVFLFLFLASNSLVLPIFLLSLLVLFVLLTFFASVIFVCLLHILSCFLKILGSVWRLLEFLAFASNVGSNSRFFRIDFGSTEPPKG